MSHSVIVYPNGMVEVTAGYDEDDEDVCDVDEVVDPVSDALDVLDEHFENHGGARVALDIVRAYHNEQVWSEEAGQKIG